MAQTRIGSRRTTPRIYISYRRADARTSASRLYDYLARLYGRDSIFMDISSISVGESFPARIEEELENTDVFLVLIGPTWANIDDGRGNRRIENPDDFVRLEIGRALRTGKIVIPVLVDGARLPNSSDLPETLGELAYRQAAVLRSDPDFARDVDLLTKAIQSTFQTSARNAQTGQATVDRNRYTVVRELMLAILGGLFGLILNYFISIWVTLPSIVSLSIIFFVSLIVFSSLILRFSLREQVIGVFSTAAVAYVVSSDTYIVLALLLGFMISVTRIPLWISLSIWLPFQHYRFTQQLRRDDTSGNITISSSEIPPNLVSVLNVSSPFVPIGLGSVLRSLARIGIGIDEFEAMSELEQTRKAFKAIVYQLGLDELARSETLRDASRIDTIKGSERNVLATLERQFLEISTAKSPIDRIQLYASILESSNSSLRDIPGTRSQLDQFEETALRKLIGLVLDDAHSTVSDYWNIYERIQKSTQEQPPANASFQEICESIGNIAKGIDRLDEIYAFSSSNSAETYITIQSLAEEISTFHLISDYPERSKKLSQVSLQLRRVTRKQSDDKWRVVPQTGQNVIVHESPWSLLTRYISATLDRLQEVDRLYLISVVDRITAVLDGMNNVEDMGTLDNQLEPILASRINYGSMIDDTLGMLNGVGRNVDAALASLQGSYNRQIALRDAQEKLNQLHTTLETRHASESKAWCQSIKRLSLVLDEHAKLIHSTPVTGYKNPYVVGNPIEPSRAALFKGRLDLADQIITKIRSGTRPTLVLYGPRRMGKTSFLLQLQNLLPSEYIVAFFAIQGTGADQSDTEFFFVLARAIYQQVNRFPGGDKLTKPSLEAFEARPQTSFVLWLEDEVNPILYERTLVVTIDEFELIGASLAIGKLTTNVLNGLRHIMQHYTNILLMFAGVENLDALGPNAASQFISATAIEISYLDVESAKELIRDPDPQAGKMPGYEEVTVGEILELTHRQPYLLQAVCSEIIDIANRDELTLITPNVIPEAIQRVHSKYSFYFQNLWESTDAAGQRVLQLLASNPSRPSDLGIEITQIEPLVQRHIICERADGNYVIEVPLVGLWVSNQAQVHERRQSSEN